MMHGPINYAAVALAVSLAAPVSRAEAGPEASTLAAADAAELGQALIRWTETRLQAQALRLDAHRASLLPSIKAWDASVTAWRVHPLWQPESAIRQTPLQFVLSPVPHGSASPIRVTLLAELSRDALVTRKPVDKGDALRCVDLDVQPRPVPTVGALPLRLPCEIAAGSVSARALGAGEPVRSTDPKPRPDVAAREPVRVFVHDGSIRIEATGVALGDASVGEAVSVRLRPPSGILTATVVAPGLALIGGRP